MTIDEYLSLRESIKNWLPHKWVLHFFDSWFSLAPNEHQKYDVMLSFTMRNERFDDGLKFSFRVVLYRCALYEAFYKLDPQDQVQLILMSC